jgi:hypothetical protein
VTITAPTTNTDQTVTLPDQTGTLYISGGALGTPSSGNGSNLTNLNASNLASGTVPDARFPATLPAASGVNLTALNASNLGSGTVPTARLATGTANNTTYLRGDQTWQTISVTPTTADVLNATAGASAGAVGTYCTASIASGTISIGSTTAGSNLRVRNGQTGTVTNPGFSGTWRNMGAGLAEDSFQFPASTFLRIS